MQMNKDSIKSLWNNKSKWHTGRISVTLGEIQIACVGFARLEQIVSLFQRGITGIIKVFRMTGHINNLDMRAIFNKLVAVFTAGRTKSSRYFFVRSKLNSSDYLFSRATRKGEDG